MKLNKILAVLGTAVLISSPLMAQEVADEPEVQVVAEDTAAPEAKASPLTFSIGVEMAYYPGKDALTTSAGYAANHFSPMHITEFGGAEGRITPRVNYTLKTPLGSHWLLSSANLNFEGYMGITPVSICPGVKVAFTPLPFLVFSAGGEAGTGWDFPGLGQGLGKYDYSTNTYVATPFTGWMLKWWAQGTFQFDTGAIIAGDWTHVLMQYSYQVYSESYTLAGECSDGLWLWNAGGNRANGLREYQNAILAYQLPIPVLKLVGVMYESDRAYSDSAYANAAYKASQAEYSLSPLAQIKINDHNSLNLLFHFKARRTYESIATYTAADGTTSNRPDSYNTTVGYEWFFNRFAISYTLSF